MRDRITTKDAFVFITLLQQDAAGIYWMIWEAMSGAFLLDWMRGSSHNASAGAPASEARGHRVPAVDDSAMNAPRAGAGEFSGQSGLLDAA
jgi:hypothetical protein